MAVPKKDERTIWGEEGRRGEKVNESSSFYSTGNRSLRFSKGLLIQTGSRSLGKTAFMQKSATLYASPGKVHEP